MARELKVVLTGDERDLNRALGRVDKRLSATQKGFHAFGRAGSTVFKGIGTAAAVGVGALAVESVRAVKAFQETRKVAAQTNAVLKSTGGVANVSAGHVADLATSISRKTGVDDEAIQSGENLLLTFTKIRDETGKGNDVFTQATSIITDMSVALGQDMKSSAIQVGKALNDPIKGVTALQRVGVSFTADQKKQIQTLEDTGHHLEAQKIILRELNTEFKGSAAAQATPLDKAKVAAGNLEEALGAGLAPAVDAVATEFTKLATKAEPQLNRLTKQISRTFKRDDLDLGDKISISWGKIKRKLSPVVRDIEREIGRLDLGDKFSNAVEKAAPRLADAMAAAAPRAAGAFVRAFRDAGPWGKIVTVAFLAQRFGAFNAAGSWAAGKFTGALKARMAKTAPEAGAAAGAEYSAAFAATGSRGVTAAGAPGGKLGKATTRAGRVLGRAGGLAMAAGFALAFGPALVDLIPADLKRRESELVSKIGGVLKGVFDQAIAPFRGGGSRDPIKIAQQEAANRSGDGGGGGAGLTPTTPLGRLPGSKGSPNEGASPRARSGSVRATTSRVARRAAGAHAPRARAAANYGLSQLAALWIQAGGDSSIAGLMAHVAMAESGGNPSARNPSGASGLWQILGQPFAGDVFDPLTNARMAVWKYNNQGLGAWEASRGAWGQYVGANDVSPSSGGSSFRSGGGSRSHPRRPRFTVGTVKPGSAGLGRGTAGPGYEQQVADADVTRATAEASDNLPALIGALQGELTLKRKRLKKVKRALRHGNRLSRATKQALTTERAQLIRDIGELRSLLKEYKADAAGGATTISGADALDAGVSSEGAPTAADFANAAIAEASLTPDTADDIAAWNSLIGTRRDELTAARATGDPRKITDAIGNLTAALDGLAGVTQQQTAIQQALLDVMTQIKGNQERLLAVATSQPNVLLNAIISALNGGIGGRVGLGFQSPSTAGRVAAGVGRL